MILVREAPETTKAAYCILDFIDKMPSKITYLIYYVRDSLIRILSMFEVRRLLEKPMLIAVSILSPVSTQTLIPTSRRSLMVSGTFY